MSAAHCTYPRQWRVDDVAAPATRGAAVSPGEERGWLPIAAFLLVIIALVALATLPGLLLSRVTSTAEEIATTVLPANDAMRDLVFALDTERQNGHGLGLAIPRRIARLLGGDLNMEAAAAGGANIILWLPLRHEDVLPERSS